MSDPEKRGRGRPPKGYARLITVRVTDALVEAMDGVLVERESREDLIRGAIEREIARRLRRR